MKSPAAAFLLAAFAGLTSPTVALSQHAVPQFQVDPLWPKPLPNNWLLGQVSVAVRARYFPNTLKTGSTMTIRFG